MKNAMMMVFVCALYLFLGCVGYTDLAGDEDTSDDDITGDDDSAMGDDDSGDPLESGDPDMFDLEFGDDDTVESCDFLYSSIYIDWYTGDRTLCDTEEDGLPAFPEVTELHNSNLVFTGIHYNEPTLLYINNGYVYHFVGVHEIKSWFGEEPCPVCENVVFANYDLVQQIPYDPAVSISGYSMATMRPGRYILRVTNQYGNPAYYLVDSCRTLRLVSAEVAEEIYGSDWLDFVRDWHLLLGPSYNNGDPVESASDYDLTAALARSISEELGCTP